MSEEDFRKMAAGLDPETRCFAENIYHLDPVLRERMDTDEHRYVGHIGEQVYLYYYDTQCLCRARIALPREKHYRIEVIDTWAMTREIVVEDVSGTIMVTLPGHEGMAVLAVEMPEEIRMHG